jgi:hypothetical protein
MTINNQQQCLTQPTVILKKNRLAYIDNLKALTIILWNGSYFLLF